ncbi:carboxylesterase family protein (plasmid) [Acidovorax sp. 210-6]|uniref:carboxylesterase/lipase family protein n=1 Tax=Acidovorax sp. 210-6 TaxID=2699468 RepID=UPI001389DBBD|nr:carboxylesterase family protein [Acidovorax sp. 210-6]NCU68010.1 carboxylesterase family protein [Acidovorax sp. 210-6]NCU68013.1 carboxylesterase family protein [Acidovorax sp. 210-6]NCU68016.1 carboxylesterase family protein [Acidovorax sp. 210-6]
MQGLKSTFIVSSLLATFMSVCVAQTAVPVVSTSYGAVSGVLSRGVRQYLGVPFAAPPVGELRWQAPQPAAPWSGTRDGSVPGERCAQTKYVGAQSLAEDCLYLNIHVPNDIGAKQLPVMVWIHGGAFLGGAATDYDMRTLATKAQAVIVSINYRLGPFGFFRTQELAAQNASVNFGLQDQQAALRWVRDEISRFGGNPGNVTIFGESAGGISVCLHLVSPQSKGLFHKAISQSGPCETLTDRTVASVQDSATQLATTAGCAQGPGLLACLRNKNTTEILAAQAYEFSLLKDNTKWAPVPDGITLIAAPDELIRRGEFNRVPVMWGTNRDEGRLFVAAEHLKSLLPLSIRQFDQALDTASGGDGAFKKKLASTYSPWTYYTLDLALAALLTDRYFSCNAMSDVQAMQQYVPVYHYEFTEANTPGVLDPYMLMGAFHGAEMRFLFQAKLPGPTFLWPLNSAQQKLADQMGAYWGNFARSGNPNDASLPKWVEARSDASTALLLNSRGISSLGIDKLQDIHHCGLWARP